MRGIIVTSCLCCLVTVLGVGSGCSDRRENSTTSPGASEAIPGALRPADLAEEWDRNPRTFEEKYKNKNFTVTGKILYVREPTTDVKKGWVVFLEPEHLHISYNLHGGFACRFGSQDAEEVRRLDKGQTVTIRGDCRLGHPALDNCVLLTGGKAAIRQEGPSAQAQEIHWKGRLTSIDSKKGVVSADITGIREFAGAEIRYAKGEMEFVIGDRTEVRIDFEARTRIVVLVGKKGLDAPELTKGTAVEFDVISEPTGPNGQFRPSGVVSMMFVFPNR